MGRTEILGEGSFGCVVSPPIPCESNKKNISKTKSEVGKIFVDAKDFKKEVATAKLVAKIDPTGKNLLTPSEHCETSTASVRDPSITWSCEALRGSGKGRLYQLMMPYGGERLDEYVKKHKPSRMEFLRLMIPVMEAIVQLQQHKYCHQDIKVSNILVTPEHKAILIDYSLMVPFNDVYTPSNRHYLRHTYLSYPPEYKAVYYKDEDKARVMGEIMANTSKYASRFRKAWAKERKWIYNNLKDLTANTNKIDVYSLGTVFIRIDEEYLRARKGTDAFYRLVDDMVAVNPAKRLSPVELLERAKNVLNM